MLEIKAEIRKMSLKIMDLIKKKDIKGINNSVSDMISVISESGSYKAQINQLTEQLQHQCKDMWKLRRSLAAAERTAGLLTTASPDSTMTSSPTRSGSTGLSPSPALAPSPTTESSAMGGDRTTSREAIVSHTPDKDSNPVPSQYAKWDTAPPWGSYHRHRGPGRRWRSSWLGCLTWPRSRRGGTSATGQPGLCARPWYGITIKWWLTSYGRRRCKPDLY